MPGRLGYFRVCTNFILQFMFMSLHLRVFLLLVSSTNVFCLSVQGEPSPLLAPILGVGLVLFLIVGIVCCASGKKRPTKTTETIETSPVKTESQTPETVVINTPTPKDNPPPPTSPIRVMPVAPPRPTNSVVATVPSSDLPPRNSTGPPRPARPARSETMRGSRPQPPVPFQHSSLRSGEIRDQVNRARSQTTRPTPPPRPTVSQSLPATRHQSMASVKSTGEYNKNDEIDLAELTFGEVLGSGAFGEVYSGVWRMSQVAIKVVKPQSMSATQLEDFKDEIHIMKNMRPHPNLVQLLGAVTSDTARLCIVMEFCAGGALSRYIRDQNNKVTDDMRNKWAIGIAAGLFHLHREGVIHRDLAARNVLLDENFKPKIADFGLARFVMDAEAESTTTSGIGAIKWSAPETLAKRQYSEKSDAWSYAVILWEILNRSEPYPDLTPVMASVKIITQKLHPSLPDKNKYPELYDIMESCFQHDANLRPNFKQICEKLAPLNTSGTLRKV